jgi:hypothetical protein
VVFGGNWHSLGKFLVMMLANFDSLPLNDMAVDTSDRQVAGVLELVWIMREIDMQTQITD